MNEILFEDWLFFPAWLAPFWLEKISVNVVLSNINALRRSDDFTAHSSVEHQPFGVSRGLY